MASAEGRQSYLAGFVDLLGGEEALETMLERLLESGDFTAFEKHLLASLPPMDSREAYQIHSALRTNLSNGWIFLSTGQNPRYSFGVALDCFKALQRLHTPSISKE